MLKNWLDRVIGPNRTGIDITLSNLNNTTTYSTNKYSANKLERFLRQLSKKNDPSITLSQWEEYTYKKTAWSLERWGLNSFALRLLEQWGKHGLMMIFAIRLIEQAHEISDDSITELKDVRLNGALILADSYLNLARANLLLSQYKKTLEHVKDCLNNISKTRRSKSPAMILKGYAKLCNGKANLGLSRFREALADFENALEIALSQENMPLQCLVCCSMSSFYQQTRDNEKVIFFPIKASEILQLHGKNWDRNYFTTTQLCLAEAYRKVGKLEESMRTAEDAFQSAIESGNKLTQAYCMLCFADIHRVRKDTNRALPRYNAASEVMAELGDRNGRLLAALGKAKVYLKTKDLGKALEEYEVALASGESIENKMMCMRIYGEMTVLYEQMSNHELARSCAMRYHQLLNQMRLFCGFCEEPIGEKHEQLEALSCSHLFHSRCVLNHGSPINSTGSCPTCRKDLSISINL